MTKRFQVGLLLMLTTYLLGGVGYKLLSPETPALDCIYMSVITVASVGYTEIVDSRFRPEIRTYTMVLILFGMAVHVYAISVVTAFFVEGDLSQYFWKRRMNRRIESMSGHYLVCGGGETGTRIIEELSRTKRDFVVIDSDENVVRDLQKLKDIAVIQGIAYEEEVLEAAGVRRASGVAVVLPNDRDNMVTILSIRALNPKIRIAVVENEIGMADRYRRAGADAIVNPGKIGGLRLVSEMIRPVVVSFLDQMLREPSHPFRFEEIYIHPNSPWANRSLESLRLRSDYKLQVVAMRKRDSTDFIYSPEGNTSLTGGETLIVLGEANDMKRAREAAFVV